MNNQVEQFSNILMIILIFLVIVLFILAIIYISIKAKENSPANLNKDNNNKNNNKDKTKNNKEISKTGTTQVLNKKSILDFMEFDKVEDNMIIQKGRKKIHNGCRMSRY